MGDTLLERARQRAAARRERQVTITLDELSIDLVCDVPTDMAHVEKLRADAKKFDKGKAVVTHFSRALVAAQTRIIRISGEVVQVDGEVVSFRDPELWPALQVADAKSAVVALIGADGDIINAAQDLMVEAGLTAEDDDDPI